ncbi:helix-turn-helix domain-containing protein [Catenuloplanes japonicus]|uniref:helix-turn-helix domain-containing protein n=1 Tax=Catenuloplanes japonicus TaxID=33876 RepID=UPI00068D07D5|nr:helix-turn-helix transcriptional regulator [Catenuloplanes japonicus]
MSSNPPITQWLAQPGGVADTLRHARTTAGVTGKELAVAAGWPPSKVSKLEAGKQMPTSDDIAAYARIAGLDDTAVQHLQDLARIAEDARTSHRRRYAGGRGAAVQDEFLQLLADATSIVFFDVAYVPGMLQTADYCRAVFADGYRLHELDPSDIGEAVAKRMRRADHLYDSSKRFNLLMTEQVLRTYACEPAVMRAQLDRLQTVIGVPHIRFGIIPFGKVSTWPQASFQMFDGESVLVENLYGDVKYVGDEAAIFARALDLMWQDAVEGDEARRLLVAAADALTTS